jgi:hypothetical protein
MSHEQDDETTGEGGNDQQRDDEGQGRQPAHPSTVPVPVCAGIPSGTGRTPA